MVQDKPALLHLEKSLEHLQTRVQEAAAEKVDLLVFGETFLTGYPAWLDHGREVAHWSHPAVKRMYSQMMQQGITVPGPETELIAQLAAQHQMVIAIGIHERVTKGPGNGTLFNGLLLFDADGSLLLHHRKLVPTYTERLVHGPGDGFGLQAVDTAIGRIGGLICWEHWMPLSRQALHDSGEDIHLALWPSVHEMHQIASRHYAFEGRCFVVAVGQLLQAKELPGDLSYTEPPELLPESWVMNGQSCVIGPDGQFIRQPELHTAGILTCTLPGEEALFAERMTLDVSGHYQRRDVFHFSVNRKRLTDDGEVTP